MIFVMQGKVDQGHHQREAGEPGQCGLLTPAQYPQAFHDRDDHVRLPQPQWSQHHDLLL